MLFLRFLKFSFRKNQESKVFGTNHSMEEDYDEYYNDDDDYDDDDEQGFEDDESESSGSSGEASSCKVYIIIHLNSINIK